MAQSSFGGFTQPKKDGGKDYNWFATGTVSGGSGTLTFNRGDNATTQNAGFITVTGLNFPLGIKVIEISGLGMVQNLLAYYNNLGFIWTNAESSKIFTTLSYNYFVGIQLDGTQAYVTNNSFRLPCGMNTDASTYSFRWRAYG